MKLSGYDRYAEPALEYLIAKKVGKGGKLLAKLDKKLLGGKVTKKLDELTQPIREKRDEFVEWACSNGGLLSERAVPTAYADSGGSVPNKDCLAQQILGGSEKRKKEKDNNSANHNKDESIEAYRQKVRDKISPRAGQVEIDNGKPIVYDWKGDKKPLINGNLAGKTHPKTGVRFDSKGFPIFHSFVDMSLPEEYWFKSDSVQFRYLAKQLYEKIEKNPNLKKEFTEEEIEQLKHGETPKRFTWHHHQEPS